MAFGCLDYIKKNTSLKTPSQLEIIGYDDISMSAWESYNPVSYTHLRAHET